MIVAVLGHGKANRDLPKKGWTGQVKLLLGEIAADMEQQLPLPGLEPTAFQERFVASAVAVGGHGFHQSAPAGGPEVQVHLHARTGSALRRVQHVCG